MRLDRKIVGNLLRDTETHMTTLFVILHAAYGDEIYDLDPLEIFARLEEDFNAELPLQAENRINAGLLCIPSPIFYRDPAVFMAVCNTLIRGDDPGTMLLEELTPEEVIWAAYEVALVREEEEDFQPSVQKILDKVIASTAYVENGAEETMSVIGEEISDLKKQLLILGVRPEDADEYL